MHCNLLIVDDEPNILSSLRRVLHKDEYSVFTASGGEEALATLAENPIDVVMSDHRMPHMSGVQFLAEVSKRHPKTVRLMLSGEADMGVMVDAINDGNIFKFVSKPWSDDKLREVVREAADLAMAARLDPTTQWLTKECFSSYVSQEFTCKTLRLVVGELRNASITWGLLSQEQQRLLAVEIENRCRLVFDLALPMANFGNGLFAFATESTGDDSPFKELSKRLSVPVEIDDRLIAIQVALGYSDSRMDDETVNDLVDRALTALNSIGHKSQTLIAGYTEKTGADLRMREQLERDMKAAMDNDNFYLEMQPQVDTKTHQIEGAEALIRWQHKDFGSVPPFKFIDIAERTGFINQMGFWVMKETTNVLKLLLSSGFESIRVSFNVSPVQLIYSEITETWLSYLENFAKEYPQAISRLELEVTESAVMTDPARAFDILTQLKGLGARIALDDFGTGHSSLAQLSKLPIDVLKFDRSLIQHIETDVKSRTLLTHLAKMSTALNLETVAEGVETDYQIGFCTDLGFNLIQGYAFYKPVKVETLIQLMKAQVND